MPVRKQVGEMNAVQSSRHGLRAGIYAERFLSPTGKSAQFCKVGETNPVYGDQKNKIYAVGVFFIIPIYISRLPNIAVLRRDDYNVSDMGIKKGIHAYVFWGRVRVQCICPDNL